MCGIVGVFDRHRAQPRVTEELLGRMADAMRHRGPDDSGVYLDPSRRLGFGFRRLSIVDLTPAGHQPMCNEDGSIWIVFNGEIYNHADHRAPLEAKGHVYRSRSDTETILHLYEEYGDDCVLHLRGMFAFAIWDSNKRRLFLARDRLGIKPLYYAEAGGTFLFASEIKALLEHPDLPREANEDALMDYFTFMIPPAPATMFRGVSKLPAGFRMSVTAGGVVSQERYWDAIVPTDAPVRDDAFYAERLRELLMESIRLHMMSDVPLGVFLSGGVDSSTNVALMARVAPGRINTFSVGFEEHETYNELQYARRIARDYGTNHHEVIIDDRAALDYLPKLVHSQDEPIADWVCLPLYFVSKLVRDRGVIVAQVGEGADELFGGYPSYLRTLAWQRKWGWLSSLPPALWHTVAGVAQRATRRGVPLATLGLRAAARMADGGHGFWGSAIAYRGHERLRLTDTPFWRSRPTLEPSRVPEAIAHELAARKPSADALERMVYLELKNRLPELLLMRVDKITMSTSIEARVPFLDHKLVEFALSIPQEVKLRDGRTKALLKRAMRGILPDEILDRPKQGFSAPVAEWLRGGALGTAVREALLSGALRRRDWVDMKYVEHMLETHVARRADHSVHLWNLFNLELWYRRWIDR